MTKNSTLFYIVDNSNNEANVELAGDALLYSNFGLIAELTQNPAKAPNAAVIKTLNKCSAYLK